jgi:FkbH-like protein
MPELFWMPKTDGWQEGLKSLGSNGDQATWQGLRRLANSRLSFAETLQLDRAFLKRLGETPPVGLATKPIRLALLGSSTVNHLFPGIRLGALRRNVWVSIYAPAYGQFFQELLDLNSPLHRFKPDAILFALDALHLFGAQTPVSGMGSEAAVLEGVGEKLKALWTSARKHFSCQVIQQTVVPLVPALMGQNEQRLPLSQRRLTSLLNEHLRTWADAASVDLLGLDDQIAVDGLSAWHDVTLWHKAKQEVSPQAATCYGDLVGRLLAANQGLGAKCLVLDLDNTLWGGVIGDDGLEGIKLGQGSAAGESFLALQRYALGLSRRGVILAVCSKNDEANALLPFEKHPEMVLKRGDIACFVANWNDKAANLREIARRLNIGLDALVFVDDNPFERNIVRRELPMVAVPELPEDPALYPATITAAGYFEALHLTQDDLERSRQYQANLQREELKASTTDLDGYLRSLEMELIWSPFDSVGLQRIVQLINKTNQFNLTTRRYTEPEVAGLMKNPAAFTLQLRLIDKFGDNGIIGIVIGEVADGRAVIDTWLMSCRVLGRGVEEATLALVCAESKRLGASEVIGEYRPTAKNGMVQEHYAKMGFAKVEDLPEGGTRWRLDAGRTEPPKALITIKKA